MRNPFENLSSQQEIKKVYRKLCLTCHPDVRPDKAQATIEFRQLTTYYNAAMKSAVKTKPKTQTWTYTWNNQPPQPQRPKPPPPNQPLKEEVRIDPIDYFDRDIMGIAVRIIRISPEMMEYGGTVLVQESRRGIATDFQFTFTVPPNTLNGQKFKFATSKGDIVITLISERK